MLSIASSALSDSVLLGRMKSRRHVHRPYSSPVPRVTKSRSDFRSRYLSTSSLIVSWHVIQELQISIGRVLIEAGRMPWGGARLKRPGRIKRVTPMMLSVAQIISDVMITREHSRITRYCDPGPHHGDAGRVVTLRQHVANLERSSTVH